jgi:CBS domain-containing protein
LFAALFIEFGTSFAASAPIDKDDPRGRMRSIRPSRPKSAISRDLPGLQRRRARLNFPPFEEEEMKVADVMTRDVACIRKNEACSAAAQLMWNRDCGAVPVVDENGTRVIGMITDRDICMSCLTQYRPPQEIFVAEAMSRELYSCSPEDTLAKAEELMRARQVRRIPVLEAGERLVGIVSLADIVREGARAGGQARAPELRSEEIAHTLADICEPRASTHQSTGSPSPAPH